MIGLPQSSSDALLSWLMLEPHAHRHGRVVERASGLDEQGGVLGLSLGRRVRRIVVRARVRLGRKQRALEQVRRKVDEELPGEVQPDTKGRAVIQTIILDLI